MVGRAMGILNGVVDPHFTNWPHLYMYVSAAWLALIRPLFPIFGSAAPYLGVRLLDAAIGTATVVIVYAFGRRAYGDRAGLLASVSLAVAFLAVRDSHFATLDTPLTFACMAGLLAALRLADEDMGRRRAAAGLLLGVAAGVKYNGALLLASLAVAQGVHRSPGRRVAIQIVAALLLGIAAFLVTSPFLLIDMRAFAAGIGYIFNHLSAASQPEIGYLHIPRLALWYGLDPPLLLLGAGGLLYALVRRTRADWILLAFVLAYYGLIGAGYSVFVRYADPLLPPLVLLGTRALVDACDHLSRPVLSTALAMMIVLGPQIAHDLAFDHLIQQRDTRSEAFDWLAAHVPAGSRVAALYFAGPAHDQALIERRNQSHGATDPYVASFLQNRLEDRYRIYELGEAALNVGALDTLEADAVDYVVYSPVTPNGGCAPATPLLRALQTRATLLASFSPTDGHCTAAVFDPIDGYYVPLGGYTGWVRPGPSIEIFALRPAQ